MSLSDIEGIQDHGNEVYSFFSTNFIEDTASIYVKLDLRGDFAYVWNADSDASSLGDMALRDPDMRWKNLEFIFKENLNQSCSQLGLIIMRYEKKFVLKEVPKGLLDAKRILVISTRTINPKLIEKLVNSRKSFKASLLKRVSYPGSPRDEEVIPTTNPIHIAISSSVCLDRLVASIPKINSVPLPNVDKLDPLPGKDTMVVGPSIRDTVTTHVHIDDHKATVSAYQTMQGRLEATESKVDTSVALLREELKSVKGGTEEELKSVKGELKSIREMMGKILEHLEGGFKTTTQAPLRTPLQVHHTQFQQSSISTPSVFERAPLHSHTPLSSSVPLLTPSIFSRTQSLPTFPSSASLPTPSIFSRTQSLLTSTSTSATPSPSYILSNSDLLLIPQLSFVQVQELAGRKKDHTQAVGMIEIAQLLGRCLFSRTERNVPIQIALIKDIKLPWSEKIADERKTLKQSYSDKDESMILLGKAIVKIRELCEDKKESEKPRLTPVRFKGINTYSRLAGILQMYYSKCGGGKVTIDINGILNVT